MRAILTNLLRGLAIGALRHRLLILRPVLVADGAGGEARTFQTLDTVWARIDTIGADAILRHGQAAQITTHRIMLRWRADIDATCRLATGSRVFTINAVSDADERRRFLVIRAEEIRP